MYEVYLITNTVNDKKYVGITRKGYKNRFKGHISACEKGKSNILYNAFRKYDIENFTVELIENNIPDDCANEREIYYIKKYNTFYKNRCGYNMTTGGGGTVGYEFTDEDRKKISESGKGRKFSKERNEKIRSAMIGREYKQEWKDNLSNARKGRFKKEENPFYGKHHSEETKHKCRVKRNTRLVERIDIETGEVLETYDGGVLAGEWVVKNLRPNTKVHTCVYAIDKACNGTYGRKTCYGYKWRYKERSID